MLKKLYSLFIYWVCKIFKYRLKRFFFVFIYVYLKGLNINIFLCLVYCFILGLLYRFYKYIDYFKKYFKGGWR